MRFQPVGLPESQFVGIFDDQQTLYTYYRVTLQFENRIMAGTPADPQIATKWLASKMGLTDEHELLKLTAETLNDTLGTDEARPGMTADELMAIAEKYAAQRSTNVFRRDKHGIYYEGRCLKAGIKESTSSLYSHDRSWGLTGKSAKGMAAERVHVKSDKLYLCRPADPYEFHPDEWEDGSPQIMREESGTDVFVGHTSGPKGPQSNLTRMQYAGDPDVPPRLYVTIGVAEDFIQLKDWARIFVHLQEIGLGSLRSQSQGKFKIRQFEKVFEGDKMPKRAEKPVKKSTKVEQNGAATAEEVLAMAEA